MQSEFLNNDLADINLPDEKSQKSNDDDSDSLADEEEDLNCSDDNSPD